MKVLATTRLSSKGQIVIPDEVRKNLGLHTGDQFVVVGENDVILLKMISEPQLKNFAQLVQVARKKAHQVKLKKNAIKSAVVEARKHK